ncbi:MAG: GatB/YqeY domain-containing protein [Candidatus Nealsonbacteria bacterium]
MALRQRIQDDLNKAVLGKEELKSSVFRLLISAINNKETEKRTKIWKDKPKTAIEDLEKESKLTDEEIINVISSEIKKRRESVELFEKGGKQEMADKEKKEAVILQQYLPEQMSEDELKKIAAEAVKKVGAKTQKDMGKVMQELAAKTRGKADGSLISKVVKELLTDQK